MNKSAIRNYAVWARNELIERVTRKAYEYGIEKQGLVIPADAEVVYDKVLTEEEQANRKQLIKEIEKKGYDQVIEEVSYTWFNRFIALRFMEVNNYLPQKIRVFTNAQNEFKPQLLDEAMNIELNGVDKELVYELIENNERDELYKLLFLATCNDMGRYLPGMFTTIADYKVLLFPDNMLKEDSVLGRLVSDIEADNFDITKEGQVEIIGWFYQFYNIEPKDKVFSRKKGTKIKNEDIPAATQLFTPDWIVRYMVENSLGRFWLEGHPNDELKNSWKYYLDEAEQEPEVAAKLEEIKEEYKGYKPEEIKLIDICMGSGHIIVYAFDVFMDIYESYGYTQRDAAKSIIENNLYGLDIDERAYQLAYFAIMMKARQYNRRILTQGVEPNIYCVNIADDIQDETWQYFGEHKNLALKIWNGFKQAQLYGSLVDIDVTMEDIKVLEGVIDEMWEMSSMGSLLSQVYTEQAILAVAPLIKLAKVLVSKYEVVVTNPPYLPVSNCEAELQKFIKKNYPDSKTDLFAVFMEKCKEMLIRNGMQAMINMHSWMFLSSFEKLREKLLKSTTIVNMAHLGARAFEEIGGEVVQTTAFVMRNTVDDGYVSSFKRLVDFNGQDVKEEAYLADGNLYAIKTQKFSKIPGSPIAYWVSEKTLEAYSSVNLGEVANPRHGLATSNNDLFLKKWFEVSIKKCSVYDLINQRDYKWFPMNKGGNYRKWYGNNDWLINYENDGYEIKKYASAIYGSASRTIQNTKYYFKQSLTWSALTSGSFSVRWSNEGAVFGSGGYSAFVEDKDIFYILALMNSKVNSIFIKIVSPTLNYEVGHIKTIPVIMEIETKNIVDLLTKKLINLSKADWDSFETSWDFTIHPLVKNHVDTVSEAYTLWKNECEDRFIQLKSNEEELNRIFIDIYGLQDELTPEVEDKDITVYRVYDEKEDIPQSMGKSKYALTKQDVIKSLVSYAVGCMFGRYSLDQPGLAYAGGQWDISKYKTFEPDKDNIIPICDDEYFQDDIVGRFVEFVKVVYGEGNLEQNLQFIADALGGKGTAREVIRNYFLNDFYKDHCKTYQKRPIYWLFDSGKKNGFKGLMYIHRYKKDTIACLRTQYVFDQQTRYDDQINMLTKQLGEDITQTEKTRLNKDLKKFTGQSEELREYEETVHHFADMMMEIDLDDGVKVNYEKFSGLLAKIK